MNCVTITCEEKEPEESSCAHPQVKEAVQPTHGIPQPQVIIRVFTPGKPKFLLQKGEPGVSVFDPELVIPPVGEMEILNSFRPGSQTVTRDVVVLGSLGLRVVAVRGDPQLPLRLQQAHAEIVPGPGMTRKHFKQALKGLE